MFPVLDAAHSRRPRLARHDRWAAAGLDYTRGECYPAWRRGKGRAILCSLLTLVLLWPDVSPFARWRLHPSLCSWPPSRHATWLTCAGSVGKLSPSWPTARPSSGRPRCEGGGPHMMTPNTSSTPSPLHLRRGRVERSGAGEQRNRHAWPRHAQCERTGLLSRPPLVPTPRCLSFPFLLCPSVYRPPARARVIGRWLLREREGEAGPEEAPRLPALFGEGIARVSRHLVLLVFLLIGHFSRYGNESG